MSYATIDDLKKKLKRFYDDLYSDDDTDVLDEDLMQSDLDAASAEIDGSVAARYVIPVTAAEALPLLKRWNLDLACELAFFRAGGSELPEKVTATAKIARTQLERISKGEFRLPADPAEKTTGPGNVALISGPESVFTRTDLEAW